MGEKQQCVSTQDCYHHIVAKHTYGFDYRHTVYVPLSSFGIIIQE